MLHGAVDEWFTWKSKYTSLTYRLSWLLSSINYTGGMSRTMNTQRPANAYRILWTNDSRKCALECEWDSSCLGYSYGLSTYLCQLNNGLSAAQPASGFVSGQKGR